jgi:hypothetical protein
VNRVCLECNVLKLIEEFKRYSRVCKKCHGLKAAAWARNNRKRRRVQRIKQHIRAYGITVEYYVQLLVKQNSRCAICLKRDSVRLSVDHDHATGRVRGLLCRKCNRAIGGLNDDPLLVQAALRYLLALE